MGHSLLSRIDIELIYKRFFDNIPYISYELRDRQQNERKLFETIHGCLGIVRNAQAEFKIKDVIFAFLCIQFFVGNRCCVSTPNGIYEQYVKYSDFVSMRV